MPGTNLKISHACSSSKFWPTSTAEDIRGVGARLAKNFFSGEDGLFQMKEFRTTLRYARKRMPKIKSSQVSPKARR